MNIVNFTKNFLLQLAYSIEIGAYLAYSGHGKVVNDPQIRRIASEELRHMIMLKRMMVERKTGSNVILNTGFFLVGSTIKALCHIAPKPLLAPVAGFMEKINVMNYGYMAVIFPEFRDKFLAMKTSEEKHEAYFLGVA